MFNGYGENMPRGDLRKKHLEDTIKKYGPKSAVEIVDLMPSRQKMVVMTALKLLICDDRFIEIKPSSGLRKYSVWGLRRNYHEV